MLPDIDHGAPTMGKTPEVSAPVVNAEAARIARVEAIVAAAAAHTGDDPEQAVAEYREAYYAEEFAARELENAELHVSRTVTENADELRRVMHYLTPSDELRRSGVAPMTGEAAREEREHLREAVGDILTACDDWRAATNDFAKAVNAIAAIQDRVRRAGVE